MVATERIECTREVDFGDTAACIESLQRHCGFFRSTLFPGVQWCLFIVVRRGSVRWFPNWRGICRVMWMSLARMLQQQAGIHAQPSPLHRSSCVAFRQCPPVPAVHRSIRPLPRTEGCATITDNGDCTVCCCPTTMRSLRACPALSIHGRSGAICDVFVGSRTNAPSSGWTMPQGMDACNRRNRFFSPFPSHGPVMVCILDVSTLQS
jgi:hypothetical protein